MSDEDGPRSCRSGHPNVHEFHRNVFQGKSAPPTWLAPLEHSCRTNLRSASVAGVVVERPVSVDTLRRRIRAGRLPAYRFGERLIKIRIEDLDNLFRPIPVGNPLRRRRAS